MCLTPRKLWSSDISQTTAVLADQQRIEIIWHEYIYNILPHFIRFTGVPLGHFCQSTLLTISMCAHIVFVKIDTALLEQTIPDMQNEF